MVALGLCQPGIVFARLRAGESVAFWSFHLSKPTVHHEFRPVQKIVGLPHLYIGRSVVTYLTFKFLRLISTPSSESFLKRFESEITQVFIIYRSDERNGYK
jgi:hypothetical protein